jgi:hypothetical protein
MQLGIIGLPKVGKTALFNTLTSQNRDTGKFSVSRDANVGVAQTDDDRLERLRDLYKPRRYTPAIVEYVDLPGFRTGEGGESVDLSKLRDVDALVHVVRAFEDPEILHSAGSVNPARDIQDLDLELILADYALLERRLEKLSQAQKRGLSDGEKREQVLLKDVVQPALEAERPLRMLELTADDERRLRGFQLLSAKPVLLVLNVDEGAIADAPSAEVLSAVPEHADIVVISATIEEEIAQLEPADQSELLEGLGLEEPSTMRLIKASYSLLGLISFFTVGEDEVRAWTIRSGTVARVAAGKIHSDIARGFIRAEVVSAEDLLELGSMSACREAARLHLEGKEYAIADGEVVHFRFNV